MIDDLNGPCDSSGIRPRTTRSIPIGSGSSAHRPGGHLSLMHATAGDFGKPTPLDPSGDFQQRPGRRGILPPDRLPQLRQDRRARPRPGGCSRRIVRRSSSNEFDLKQHIYVPISDESRVVEIGRKISPIITSPRTTRPRSSSTATPTSSCRSSRPRRWVAKLKESRGRGQARRQGRAPQHGWAKIIEDFEAVADWFDTHLKSSK